MPSSASSRTWVEIGRVVRPHSLKGALLVQLHGDDPGNLSGAESVVLSGKSGETELRLRRSAPAGHASGGGVRIRIWLDGLESRDAAEAWIGARLSIAEGDLRTLPDGEYYWRELLGLRCRLPGGDELGVLEEIWPTGSHDVLVIRGPEQQHLVPALRGVLVRLDRERGELWIDPPEGLVDEA